MRAAACWLELVALASASFLPRSGAGDAVSRWQLQTRDRVHWDDLHRAITQWRCDDARRSRYVTLRTPSVEVTPRRWPGWVAAKVAVVAEAAAAFREADRPSVF